MTRYTRRQTLASLLAGSAATFAREAAAADALAAITFLLVNDVYEIDESIRTRGGFPRLAAVVKAERARALAAGRRLVFVHAGDTLSPSLVSSFDQGAHMVALFDTLGLDLFVPGNHEFDFGPAIYRQRMAEATFQVLAANMRDQAGRPLAGHLDEITIDVGGVSIAMIGSAYDATPGLSHSDDLVFAPTPETIRERARVARAKGADFVVAIVHADKAAGAAIMNAHVVDLILSGHNHDLHVDFDGRTAFAESAQDANFVTAVDLDIAVTTKEGARAISWWPRYRITDTADVTPDPDMLATVRSYQARLAATLDVTLATLTMPLDSRTELVRTEEAAIGNFIADAMRTATGADIALVNGGGIRGNRVYEKGASFLRRDVMIELPFGNKTLVTAVSGKAMIAALENGLSAVGKPSGRFPQTSGLIVEASRAASSSGRVRTVLVNGAVLEPDKIYKVATNDFMARGGDGYGMLAGTSRITIDSGDRLVAQNVMDLAERSKTIGARVEGRMLFT